MSVKKYRKKPVVIAALELSPEVTTEEIQGFCPQAHIVSDNPPHGPTNWDHVRIMTLEGVMIAHRTDYIICGIEGKFYPCKANIFVNTYELAE